MKYKNVEIIKSRRRTISLEVRIDGAVIVRAPLKMSDRDICTFIDSKKNWIKKHSKEAMHNIPKEYFTEAEIKDMYRKAKEIIPERAAYYAEKLNVEYNRITIRSQKTRWGSCSAKKNLSFNCLLAECPGDILDYVVVHELCHLVVFNHSRDFWALVGDILPEYRKSRTWLKENGPALILKMNK